MMRTEVDHYGLGMSGYNVGVGSDNVTEVTLIFKTFNTGAQPDLDKFSTDISLMNKIRNSSDPAVDDAFDKLLTIMALTNPGFTPKKKV
jgi:hypothetical protein